MVNLPLRYNSRGYRDDVKEFGQICGAEKPRHKKPTSEKGDKLIESEQLRRSYDLVVSWIWGFGEWRYSVVVVWRHVSTAAASRLLQRCQCSGGLYGGVNEN